MTHREVSSGNVRTTRRNMMVAILMVVAVAFVCVSAWTESSQAAGENYDQTIVYSDPEGGNTSVTVGYYGIASTEYNPEYWNNTGNVDDKDNWRGPLGDNPIHISGDEVGWVLLNFDNGQTNIEYTIYFPNSHQINRVVPISNANNVTYSNYSEDVGNSATKITYTQVGTSRAKIAVSFNDFDYTPQMVFGGWMNGDETVLPGDVVGKDVNSLSAKWITPDVFILKKDTIDWNYVRGPMGNNYNTGINLAVVSSYANIGFVSGNGNNKDQRMAVICYEGEVDDNGYQQINAFNTISDSKDDVTIIHAKWFGTQYSKVIRGDHRTQSDMFGTIYHLTKERTASGVFNTAIGKIAEAGRETIPTGTYRTPDADVLLEEGFSSGFKNYERPTLMFDSSDPQAQARLSGNVIIDSVDLDAKTMSKHGDDKLSSIFADGHILIMGTNIRNPNLGNNDKGEVVGAPQVYGGVNVDRNNSPKNIETAVVEGKKIVFGDSNHEEVTADLGTFVIIHSGVYGNIIAGSFGMGDIGTASKPLSTYLILKGGSSIDTVVGGGSLNSNVKSKTAPYDSPDATIYGDTYLYLINHFAAGDDWEDGQTGCFEGDRAKYSINQSSIVEGGNSRGKVYGEEAVIKGSTHVFLTGTSSVWDVQAGGRSEYTEAYGSYLEITGQSVVRHVACGTITDGAKDDRAYHCVEHVSIYIGGYPTVASVYGAGYDTTYYPMGSSMSSGTIDIKMEGGRVGNIFGGGYRGIIGTPNNMSDDNAENDLNINLEISGGTVYGSVYGGGSGGLEKVRHDPVTGKIAAGNISAYKTSTGKSFVYGDIRVSVTGTATVKGSVYGGGMSVPTLRTCDTYTSFSNESINNQLIHVALVQGDSTVIIGGNANIEGSVFGGGKGIDESKLTDPNEYEPSITTVNVANLSTEQPFYQMPWFAGATDSYSYNATNNYSVAYKEYAKITGDTLVIIEGGSIKKDVYGGGAQGKVYGSTKVVISGGEIVGNVFGGGLGVEDIMAVSENRGVYVTGSSTRIKGSVYGGSSKGYDGIKKDTVNPGDSTSIIVIDEGVIDGSVFGGGFKGATYGDTYIYVGHSFDNNYQPTYYTGDETKTIKLGSIYAGGNVSQSADETGDETEIDEGMLGRTLVMGTGHIRIYGNGNHGDISISGSILGSGNACMTKGGTDLEIVELQNKTVMTGIHRMNTALITQSFLEITGRSPVTESRTASLYGIGVLTLKHDTVLSITNDAYNIGALRSVITGETDDVFTTMDSPSNSIILTGAKFEIGNTSNNNFTPGQIQGHIMLSTQESSNYGAYVLCSSASEGKFVVLKEGSIRYADKIPFSNNTDCWYIGGTERVSLTMNLQADKNGNMHVSEETIKVIKMNESTTMRYVGGEFTSLSSVDTNDYEFISPDLITANHQFGLIFGTPIDNSAKVLTSKEKHTFNNIGIDEIYSAYFGEDAVDFNSGVEGEYDLKLILAGAPTNASAYLGYITLNFVEIETTENIEKPVNNVEIRIDFYVMKEVDGEDPSTFGTNYSVKLRTERDGDEYSGYTDVLFPKTAAMSELKLKKIEGITNGAKVNITAMVNQDNTTGWMIPSILTLNADGNYDKSVGILSGSSVATVRYYVEYNGEWNPANNIVMTFQLTIDGTPTESKVTLHISEKNKVTVTFKGMYANENNTSVSEFYYGSKLDTSKCPDTGRGFVGWYTDSERTNLYNGNSLLKNNITLYAKYLYTVTFDNMNGTTSQKVVSPGKMLASTMPTPERTGYTFGGWFKDESLENKWNPAYDEVTGDITLYAKWTGLAVKINFLYEVGNGWSDVFGDAGYVIKTVNNEKIYATVRVGSTFDMMDPVRNMEVLDYARDKLLEIQSPNKKFIRWQAYTGNNPNTGSPIPIYHDMYMTESMYTVNENVAEINLYAITSSVAIKVVMDKTNYGPIISDASAVVMPPAEYYVYPDVPADLSYPDGRGCYLFYDENTLEEFIDTVIIETIIHGPDGDEIITEETDVTHYRDKYNNVWSKNNDETYSLVRSTIYYLDINDHEVMQIVEDGNYPASYYFKDKYGNRYTLSAGNKPTSVDDQYTTDYGDTDKYYQFTFTLNDAELTGYRLKSWHNTLIDEDVIVPKAGDTITLKIFTKVEDNKIKVLKTVKETFRQDGTSMIVYLDNGLPLNEINNVYNDYVIKYQAEWELRDYVVTIPSTANGEVDAFLLDTNGNRTLITGSITAHYGDVVELFYTQTGNYMLNRWVVTGQCVIDDAYSPQTTAVVTGNCSITASEIGERFVNLNMIFDTLIRANVLDQNMVDELERTKVFMHEKGYANDRYYEMTLRSGKSVGDPGGSKLYSGYVPLGQYEVCVRYGSSTDYQECVLMGGLTITNKGNADYTYYVISAIIDTTDTVTIGDNEQVRTSENYKDALVKYTKYVGGLDSLVFGQDMNLIVNNPEGNLPAVQVTIAPGYAFTVLEGYFDGTGNDQHFMLNEEHNLKRSTDANDTDRVVNPDGSVTLKFHLNWTKFDKPALLFIKTNEMSCNVTYKLINEDGTPFEYNNSAVDPVIVPMEYGETFISKAPADFSAIMDATGNHISGWFYNSYPGQPVIGNRTLTVSDIASAGPDGIVLLGVVKPGITKNVMIRIQSEDIEGNVYTTQATVVVPLLEQEDHTFSIKSFQMIRIDGLQYETSIAPSGFDVKPNLDVPGTFTITAANAGLFNGPPPEIFMKYSRNHVNIEIAHNASEILSGAWAEGKTSMFEEEVPLPIMKKDADGNSVTGWMVRKNHDTDSNAEWEESDSIIKIGGVFYFRASGEDTLYYTDEEHGIIDYSKVCTLEFKAVYSSNTTKKVTFITPIGQFASTGTQRLVVNVTDGKVSQPGLIYDSTNYRLLGFVNGNADFDFNSTITSDLTLAAKFESKNRHTFSFDYLNANAAVSTNAPGTPTSQTSSASVYTIDHGVDIIVTIKPNSGYDLDIERTMSETLSLNELNPGDIDYPLKLSDNRGYGWKIIVDKDIALKIYTKNASANINFFVNGYKVTDFVDINDDPLGGQSIPLYTVVQFNNYGDNYWFTEPELGDGNKLTFTLVEDKPVYTITVTEDISLYTTNNSYRIYYHNWDGTLVAESGLITSAQTTIGQVTVNESPVNVTCEMDGYIFVGWATLNDQGQHVYAYPPIDEITLNTNMPTYLHLYAFYLKDGNATLMYNGKGQYSSIENDPSLNQIFGKATLEVHYDTDGGTMTKSNYATRSGIDGPYVYPTHGSSVTQTDLGDKTVRFVGVIIDDENHEYVFPAGGETGSFTITVTYNHIIQFYDGDVFLNEKTKQKIDGQAIGELPALTDTDDRDYLGWYAIDKNNNEIKLEEDTLVDDLPVGVTRVYALWNDICTVTFNPTEGHFPGMQQGETIKIVTSPGQKIDMANVVDPVRTLVINNDDYPYSFIGWFNTPDNNQGTEFNPDTEITKSITLLARWQATLAPGDPAVDIYFYAVVGGSIPIKVSEIHEYPGAVIANPGNPPMLRGMEFKGWYECTIVHTGQGPDSISNVHETSFQFNTSLPAGEYHVVPQYQYKAYNLILNYNYAGHTDDIENPLEVGTAEYTVQNIPVRDDGYEFKGWSLTSDGEVLITGTTITVNNETINPNDNNDVRLYAIWDKKNVIVTYQIGGDTVATQTVEYGNRTNAPAIIKEGSRLNGWFKDDESQFAFSTAITENLVLHGYWIDQHTVSFDIDGGMLAIGNGVIYDRGSIKIDTGNLIFGIPQKDNTVYKDFEFGGWFTDPGFKDAVACTDDIYSIDVNSNVTIYAKWNETVKAYKVSFYSAYGGQNPLKMSEQIVQVSDPYYTGELMDGNSPEMQRNGLSFNGWYEFEFISIAPGYRITGTAPFTHETLIEHDYQLIPSWIYWSYFITVDLNYEDKSTTEFIEEVYGKSVSLDIEPREGWALKGFSATPTGRILYQGSWIQFPIRYSESELERTSVSYQSFIQNVKYESYWADADPDDVIFELKLYAIWGEQCTIKLDLDDGSVPYAFDIDVDSQIERPNDPVRNGYRFLYWYDAGGNGEEFDFSTHINMDVTLKAKWQKTYNVIFESNGTIYDEQTIDAGDKITRPTDPADNDYKFIQWHLEGVTTEFDFENTIIDEDVTLIADWTSKTKHLVRFYGQYGGSPDLRSSILINDGGYILRPDDPVMEGGRMTFVGWYEFEVRDGSIVITGTEEFKFGEPVTRDYDIITNWQIDVYTIILNANNGTDSTTVLHQPIYGAPIFLNNIAMSNGDKVLVGWATSPNGDVVYPANMIPRPLPEIPSKIMTLYAIWEESVTVTFDSNGGSAVDPVRVAIGHTITEPSAPIWAGHTFNGWYLNKAAFDFDTPITTNITLTAKWTLSAPDDDDDDRPAPHTPHNIVEKESKTISNDDGSTTRIDKETIIEKDGSTTQKIEETTSYEDGSTVVKKEIIHTDRFGNKTSETSETSITTDGRGSRVEETVTTVIGSDSSRTEEHRTVTDDDGRIVEKDVKIVNTDSEGHQTVIIIKGDSDRIEAYLPNTELDILHQAETIIDGIAPKKADLVLTENYGEFVIPFECLWEASYREYSISLDGNSKRITFDESVVQNLAKKGGDAYITIKKVEPKDLTEGQRKVIGNNDAYAMTLVINDVDISQLGGLAEITIQGNYDHVYYITNGGSVEAILCERAPSSNTVSFTLEHFSIYALTDGPLKYDDDDNTMVYVAIGAIVAVLAIVCIAVAVKKRSTV